MGYKGFSEVQLRKPQRSTFDLSHDKRLSVQMGYLYPVLVQECLPSDHFYGNTDLLVRLAPLLAPIFDQIQIFIHYFFVPCRLIWEEWETFIAGPRFGDDVIEGQEPIPPYFNVLEVATVNINAFDKSRLPDYLGIPLLMSMPDAPHTPDFSLVNLDAMPFGAYQKIWYDYYRDRNFVRDANAFPGGLPFPFASDLQQADIFEADFMTLRSCGYKADYFMTALPSPQRGPEMMIPSTVNYLAHTEVYPGSPGGPLPAANVNLMGTYVASTAGPYNASYVGAPAGDTIQIRNIDTIGPLVNDFRTAYALQVWLERNAIAGNRYSESIEAHFGVRPQDSRLQRAEYIGGGMLNVKISEVVATAWSQNADTDSVPQGNMAGHGVSFGSANGFSWFCAEHGFIMGIMSIVNPPSYHQGLPRMFRRKHFLDYPFPSFAKLGEQEVYKWEVYASSFQLTSADADPLGNDWPVFGYQSRYADWKSGRNTSHGDFHDTMLYWTLTNDYGISQDLNESFVTFDPNIEARIFAAPLTDNFWIYLHNRVTAHRPLPYFGTPNTMGFE